MTNLLSLVFKSNQLVGRYGPKVAAVGILLCLIGEVLQGNFENFNTEEGINALIALGLWGSRPDKVTSEKSGAKKLEDEKLYGSHY